jgi:hypothetical protein
VGLISSVIARTRRTAGHIDYVTLEDFLNLQLAEPFRTLRTNYSVRDCQMNFRPGTRPEFFLFLRTERSTTTVIPSHYFFEVDSLVSEPHDGKMSQVCRYE